MRLQFWAADTLRFFGHRAGAAPFFEPCAAAGVRLRRVRWQRDGYTATVSGADRRRLERIARDGGWTLAVTARRGPGKHTERLLQTRPGWPRGRAVFAAGAGAGRPCLVHRLWRDGPRSAARHAPALADCGIHEGVLLTKPLLQTAQAQALRRSERIRLGQPELYGRLPCHREHALPDPDRAGAATRQGLYASADGEILPLRSRAALQR